MKKIIATEKIFSPLSHGKPIAIRYHYADGTNADAPVIRKTDRSELPDDLRRAIVAFEAKQRGNDEKA
ncbi:MAG: hypothetical protein WCQ65_12025 [Fermentimonas sp.]|jgi:hypothetical protein